MDFIYFFSKLKSMDLKDDMNKFQVAIWVLFAYTFTKFKAKKEKKVVCTIIWLIAT